MHGNTHLVRYHVYREQRVLSHYTCHRHTEQRGERPCQVIPGSGIDAAISKLLVEAVTPLALEVALSVQQEIQTRVEEADHLRRTQVERARYEVQLAQRRYLQVDPDNRLVAGAPESDWNVLRYYRSTKRHLDARPAFWGKGPAGPESYVPQQGTRRRLPGPSQSIPV